MDTNPSPESESDSAKVPHEIVEIPRPPDKEVVENQSDHPQPEPPSPVQVDTSFDVVVQPSDVLGLGAISEPKPAPEFAVPSKVQCPRCLQWIALPPDVPLIAQVYCPCLYTILHGDGTVSTLMVESDLNFHRKEPNLPVHPWDVKAEPTVLQTDDYAYDPTATPPAIPLNPDSPGSFVVHTLPPDMEPVHDSERPHVDPDNPDPSLPLDSAPRFPTEEELASGKIEADKLTHLPPDVASDPSALTSITDLPMVPIAPLVRSEDDPTRGADSPTSQRSSSRSRTAQPNPAHDVAGER